jgi:pyruvate,water dikinase
VQEQGLQKMVSLLESAGNHMGEEETVSIMKGWRNLNDISAAIPVPWRGSQVTVDLGDGIDGYVLPHSLQGKGGKEKLIEESGYITVRPLPGEGKDQSLVRALHDGYQKKLIDPNFAALDLIGSHAESIDKETTLLLLKYLGTMIDFLEEMIRRTSDDEEKYATELSDYSDRKTLVSDLRNDFDKLQEELLQNMESLESGDALKKKVVEFNPSTVHGMIRRAHEAGNEIFAAIAKQAGSNISVTVGRNTLDVANLGEKPIIANGEIVSKPLLLLLQTIGQRFPFYFGHGDAVIIDNRLFVSIVFGGHQVGGHRAEIAADLSDVDSGGFLKVRYFEANGMMLMKRLRLQFLRTIFGILGIHNGMGKAKSWLMLNAVLDKDHGATGSSQIENALRVVLRILLSSKGDLDSPLLEGLTKFVDGEWKAAVDVPDLAKLIAAQGKLPFERDREKNLSLKYETYNNAANTEARNKLRDALNYQLRKWGFAPIPVDIPFGQRVIDESYTGLVMAALARGELNYNDQGIPEKNPRYDPIVQLLDSIKGSPANALQTAMTLNSLPDDVVQYEPIGYAGELTVVRGQFELEGGVWVVVNGAMDPVSRSLVYAEAAVRYKGKQLQTVTAEKLVEVLNHNGMDVVIGYMPNELQRDAINGMLRSQVPLPEEGLREARGISGAAGKQAWVTGTVSFDRAFTARPADKRQSIIFAAPYTTTDDVLAIEEAVGILTTSGGPLSHAALVAKAKGKSGIIVRQAVWETREGKKQLKITYLRPGPVEKRADGIEISRSAGREELIIREGDIVSLNGREGIVRVYAKGSKIPALTPLVKPAAEGESKKKAAMTREPGIRAVSSRQQWALIVPLSQLGKEQTNVAGGKGAQLGEIMKIAKDMGFIVPAGLSVTTAAFDRFLDEAGIRAAYEDLIDKLDEAMNGEDIDETVVKKYSEDIRNLIQHASFGSLGDQVLSEVDRTKLDSVPLAVRSSAVQEDTKKDSFAGMAESYMYVNRDDLLEKIKGVWESFYYPRSIIYRAVNDISQREVGPAVVVQGMVEPTVSGVAYGTNGGDQDEVLIEAAYGLGEMVVSGQGRTDIHRVQKSDGREIVPVIIGNKRRQMVANGEKSGVQSVPVDRFLRKRRALSPDEVKRISDTVRELEKHFGYPVDVEFAVTRKKDPDGKTTAQLFILQVRPVTKTMLAEGTVQQDRGVVRKPGFEDLSRLVTPSRLVSRQVLPLTLIDSVMHGVVKALPQSLIKKDDSAAGTGSIRDLTVSGKKFFLDTAIRDNENELKQLSWKEGHEQLRRAQAEQPTEDGGAARSAGEARRRQLNETLAKGKELIIGMRADLAEGREKLVAERVKGIGVGNIRLTGITDVTDGSDREALESAAAQKKTAALLRDAGLKVLRDRKLKKDDDPGAVRETVLKTLAETGKPAADVPKTVFDGVEIDASEIQWGVKELAPWLNSIGRARPEARISVVPPENIDLKAFREALDSNIAIVEEGTGMDGNSFVKIHAKGADLAAKLAEVDEMQGTSFEISLDGDVLQLSAIGDMISGLMNRINEKPSVIYEEARAAGMTAGIEVYKEIRALLHATGIMVEGKDFEAAVRGKDLDQFLKKMEQLKGMPGVRGTLLESKAEEILKEAEKPEMKERAAAKLAALLKGSGEAMLVNRYLELKGRSGFEKEEDHHAFGALLWTMGDAGVIFLATEKEFFMPEEARLTGNAAIDRLAQYIHTGAGEAEVPGILNRLRSRVGTMPGHEAAIYAQAYAKYGQFGYFETLGVINEARSRVQSQAGPDPLSLVDSFRLLELLSDEKLRLEQKMKPAAGVNTKTMAALLGAA